MSVPIDDFWRLTGESQLLPVEKYRALRLRFRHLRGADGRANSRALASWLVSQKALTTYQAQVLLSGRSGPFTYGDYRVCNRIPSPLGARRFDGLHLPTNHRLLMHFWPHGAEDWPTTLAAAQRHIALMHPHLDRCYEIIEAGGQCIALSEDVDGVPVAESIKAKPLSPTEAIRVAHQVAVALQQIHNAQLVHGFVTPDDIFVAGGGHTKLRRFPIARRAPLDVDSPDPKQRLLRQADYLAPELRRPDQPPSPLADIYALGCTLYETLKGRPPFPDGSLSEKMERHAAQRIESLDDLPSIPDGLPEVVSFMMAKKPSLRYQSAAEVAQKLEAFLGSAAHTIPPRPKATEPYYLAHLNKQTRPIPTHLQSPDGTLLPPAQPHVDPPMRQAPVAPLPKTDPSGTTKTPPAVAIAPMNLASQSKSPRRSTATLALSSAVIVIIISVLVLILSLGRGRRNDGPTPNPRDGSALQSPQGQSNSGSNGEPFPDNEAGASAVVADDGQTLWLSPTTGKPITVGYTPPSSQCFLHLRPRELLQTSDGPAVLTALGPKFESFQDQLASRLGLSLEQLDTLLVALVPQDTEPPRATLVMRLATQDLADALASRAQASAPSDGGRRLSFDAMEVYLPAAAPTMAIAGSPQDIQEVIDQAGQPPLVKRQVEQLRLMTDDHRHLTVLLDPHFLAADGRDTFAGEFARLRKPVLDFLGDQTQAVSLSVHFDQTFYGELLLSSTLDQDPFSLAAACKSRLKALPETVNSQLGKVVIERFWQPLAVRFPLMINFLHQQTRIGVSDRCAMVNFAMPEHSAHNLVLASVLAVEASAMSEGDVPPPEPQALDWDAILAHRIDFEIPQQSLEFTMLELATAIDRALPQAGIKIVIIGGDLQLDGITRNQQIRDVNLKNQSVNEILTELVRRANPTPADSIASPDQKLVWVPDREGEGAGRTVFITTRAGATRKGYSLPRQFLENSQEP